VVVVVEGGAVDDGVPGPGRLVVVDVDPGPVVVLVDEGSGSVVVVSGSQVVGVVSGGRDDTSKEGSSVEVVVARPDVAVGAAAWPTVTVVDAPPSWASGRPRGRAPGASGAEPVVAAVTESPEGRETNTTPDTATTTASAVTTRPRIRTADLPLDLSGFGATATIPSAMGCRAQMGQDRNGGPGAGAAVPKNCCDF
jgi:hypothetical protein